MQNYHLPDPSSIPLEKGSLPLCGGGVFQGPLTSLGKQCEITVPPPVDKEAIYRRLERFDLQSLAAEILEPFKRMRKNGNLDSPSVCNCMRVPRKKYVEIWKSVKHGRHYYAGLATCGSVWDCLPCAAKISEFRGQEIKQAVETCQDRGGSVVMLTQTFPHYENQKCKPLLDKFGQARQIMKNRKTWRNFVSSTGMIGNINRTEVTYGKNGWHVHCHTLLFFSSPVKLSSGQIFPMWESACVASGLPSPSKAHGVKISTPKQMADYIAKQGKETSNWTLEAEMTKGHTKRGGLEGMTPFDLLRSYRDTKNDTHKRLFAEYSQTFKGKRQLVWSRGLRDLLHLSSEKTDEEILEQQDELDELFVMIETQKLWPLIRKLKMRGQLLEAANLGEEKFTGFLRYLQTLGGYVELPF
jgi:hypothetical protein